MTTTASAACTTVFDARLPSLAYLDAQNPDDAHRRIRAARQQAPIALGSYGPEILTYDLARAVLRDGRFRTPPRCRLRALGITSGPLWDMNSNSLASLNGANHHRLRKLVSRAFTPCGAERLRATVVDIIAELVNPFTNAGRCDVVSDIALRYPVPVICAALGVPRADWQLFSRWADELMNLASNRGDTSSMVKSLDELHSYIDVMVADRCRKLTDDVLSELILAEADGDELEADEFRMLVGTLLTAGADTARHQLAASVELLCDHPDKWALLAKHPELASRAVEETMRHSPILFSVMRIATDDVELASVLIPAGTLVCVNTAAANRDPEVYDDPDRLDFTRNGSPAMLAFGDGVHHCLGAHLARIELAEALRLMARRMPNIRRAGPAPWKPLSGISGPITVPVEFNTGH